MRSLNARSTPHAAQTATVAKSSFVGAAPSLTGGLTAAAGRCQLADPDPAPENATPPDPTERASFSATAFSGAAAATSSTCVTAFLNVTKPTPSAKTDAPLRVWRSPRGTDATGFASQTLFSTDDAGAAVAELTAWPLKPANNLDVQPI